MAKTPTQGQRIIARVYLLFVIILLPLRMCTIIPPLRFFPSGWHLIFRTKKKRRSHKYGQLIQQLAFEELQCTIRSVARCSGRSICMLSFDSFAIPTGAKNSNETSSNRSSRNKHTKLKLYTFLARPRGDHRKPCDIVPNVGDAYEPDVGILLNSGCESNFAQCSCPNLVTFRRVVVPFSCCCVVMWKIPLRDSWGTLSNGVLPLALAVCASVFFS